MGLDPLATDSSGADRSLLAPLGALYPTGNKGSGLTVPNDPMFGRVSNLGMKGGDKTITKDLHIRHGVHLFPFYWRTQKDETVVSKGFPQGSVVFVATSPNQKPMMASRMTAATKQPALGLQDINCRLLEDAQREEPEFNSVKDLQKSFALLGLIEAAMTTGEDTTLGIDFGRPANGAMVQGGGNMYTYARRGRVDASDLWDSILPAGTEIGFAIVQCDVSATHARRSDHPALQRTSSAIRNAFQIMPLCHSSSRYNVDELSFITENGKPPVQVGWIHVGTRFMPRHTGRVNRASRAAEYASRALSYKKGASGPRKEIWFTPDDKPWGF